MKKTHKKILGFLGILTVAGVTAAAILMPSPETRATDTTSVTDTLTVRVVTEAPNVDILGIDSGEVITTPNQAFAVDYSDVSIVDVIMEHTPLEGGETTTYAIDSFDANWDPGTMNYNIHFIRSE